MGSPCHQARRCAALLLATSSALVHGFALPGCGDGPDSPPTGSDRPFRDEWRLEFSAPFPYDGESDDPGIERITIGEPYAALGAKGRGDVIVLFDAPAGTIEVEQRRFTYAGSEDEAVENFERLGFLAIDLSGRDCSARWYDDCTLTMTYEGQSQPLRDGSDFRVHLPADYHHHLEIEAHDISEDSDYPDRGNVCLATFEGDATINVDSGAVFVTLSDATVPAPRCLPAALAQCEAVGWGEGCGCAFGRMLVDNRELHRSDVTIDIPVGLWATIDLTNVDTSGGICDLDIDLPDVVLQIETEQHVRGEVARPEDAEASAEGYEFTLRSVQCSTAAYVSGPDDFGKAKTERRGDLRVCSGCIGGRTCEELLEGL